VLEECGEIVFVGKKMKNGEKRKNRENILRKLKKWVKELNEYKNNKCKKCDKLLNFNTKSNLCRSHSQKELSRLYKKYGNHEKASKEYRRKNWKE
jgi:hypothetical protein